MEEVTLEQVLVARELRAGRQDWLLKEYGGPVISFTMNIPGPVKDTPLIRRAFFAGRASLRGALDEAGIELLHGAESAVPTGCELQYAVKGDPLEVKRLCVGIEDATPLGRLFDMDVLAPDGAKLDREAVNGGERNCIVCGAKGRGCASRRSHSIPELQAAVRRIIEEYFVAADRRAVSELVTKALLDEVYTTPKPGLVDRNNNGSHKDMTVATFERSAAALAPYWGKCFDAGRASSDDAPEKTFLLLREEGKAAERDMLAATDGVNTHKGAIYTLGVICGALGRLWRAEKPCRDISRILRECAAMTRSSAEQEFETLSARPESARTTGQRLFLQYGMRGIRGEVAEGLPGITRWALPMMHSAKSAGFSRNDAGVFALLCLIARNEDTNMVARGGVNAAKAASDKAARLLANGAFPRMDAVRQLDADFMRENLSPGGCADLLAAAYFVEDWRQL